MKKRFKPKRKLKYKKTILTLFLIIILILILRYISKLNLIKQDALKTITYSNNTEKIDIKQEFTDILTQIIKIDINQPTTILKNTMYYEKPNIKKEYYIIENKNEEPQIYIYNTHQLEEYNNGTVQTAAQYLKEKLEQLGLKTIVEENNYAQTYETSRVNLEKIKNQYPNIKIFIDLHRDSVRRELSTVTIDNKEYAKILFVIGKEHDNYQKNLEYTNTINNIIMKYYPQLTKGILEKEGRGVNGIYNQDMGENIILMEVGGIENTIEEVKNTLDIMSNIIKEKIDE